MATDELSDFVGVAFSVTLDNIDIGQFSSCEGFGLEVVLEQREEGGNNGLVWQLPTRMKYSNIKLSRPIGKDSEKLTKWIVKALNGLQPSTGHITALNVEGQRLVEWTLDRVIPVRWTGPSLTLDSAKVFTETLEIAHHGFTPKVG